MGSKTLKWGILGAAWIAKERVIPAIRMAKDNELVAIASRSEGKRLEFARQFNIPKQYESYKELLKDQDIDAVYIPLPNHLHAKWTMLAARYGKHVLCEKPAAITMKETKEMVAACAENRVIFMEGFAFRCHPSWQQLKELLHTNHIGKIKNIRVNYSISVDKPSDIRLQKEFGGGVMYDIGSYCINGICDLMDSDPIDIDAQAEWNEDDVDTAASVSLVFSNERSAQITCSFHKEYHQQMEIVGTDATIVINRPFHHPELLIKKDDAETKVLIPQGDINIYTNQIEHFASIIKKNTTPLYAPIDSIRNMKVIESIYNCMRKGHSGYYAEI